MIKNNLRVDSPPSYLKKNVSAPSSTDADTVISLETHRISQGQISSALLGARPTRLGKIAELFQTRNSVGWDGCDAVPITRQSKQTAETIINMLPLEIADPEIVPTCNGGYSLEWKEDRKYLVIEIENKEVSCVLIDAEKRRKKTSFTEEYQGDYEDFPKWVRDEFPLNGQH